jgi:hypothetical protein
MARKKVIKYIKGLLQKGYSISSIKNTMLRYGYSSRDIDGAVEEIYNPTIRHEIHLSKTALLAVIIIAAAVLGAAFFAYFSQPKAPEKLLDLNLEPVKTSVEAGSSISFIKEISNLGSLSRYDVFVEHQLIDTKTSKIITGKNETIAVETSSSKQTSLLVPEGIAAGDYLLRTVVTYDGRKAVATLPVKITSSKRESCFDGIKNQDEEKIDCVGICKPCSEVIIDCDDGNPCTEDVFENGICSNNAVIPCCGNNICETNEACAADCAAKQNPPGASPETLEDIKDIGRSDPARARQLCGQLDVPDIQDVCISNIGEVQKDKEYCESVLSVKIKDTCHSTISKLSRDKSLCKAISGDGIRDSCYAYFFVPPNKDYSVCELITNKDLRGSCNSLKQLDELHSSIPGTS